MAKDGTNRGDARIGAGAKKKPLADKIAEGNPGKRALTVISFDDRAAELEGQAMPKPSKMLSAVQKDGKALVAEDIYKEDLGVAGRARLRLSGISTASGALRHECGPLDTVRGGRDGVRLSGQASHHRQRDTVALCGDESELYEPDQPALDGNIPNRKRKLRDRVHRCHSDG